MNVRPPSSVRWSVFSTDSNSNRPTREEIVGSKRAPHRIRVTESASDIDGAVWFWFWSSSSSSLLNGYGFKMSDVNLEEVKIKLTDMELSDSLMGIFGQHFACYGWFAAQLPPIGSCGPEPDQPELQEVRLEEPRDHHFPLMLVPFCDRRSGNRKKLKELRKFILNEQWLNDSD